MASFIEVNDYFESCELRTGKMDSAVVNGPTGLGSGDAPGPVEDKNPMEWPIQLGARISKEGDIEVDKAGRDVLK